MKSLKGCRVLQVLVLYLIVGLLDLAAVTPLCAQSTDLPQVCEQTCSSSSDCTDSCFSSCEVSLDGWGNIKNVTCEVSTCGESATCGSCDEFCSKVENCGKSCPDKNGFTQPCPACSDGDDSGGDDSSGGSGSGLPAYEELLRGRVWQSSTAWGGEASRAVDGKWVGDWPQSDWASGSVTHTDINVRPEWHIYTNHEPYKSVTIYNRTDCCGERLGGASVWVHNWDAKSGTYIWRRVATLGKQGQNPGRKIHISFYGKLPNVYANALAIMLPEGSKVPLSLAEVMLWGCGGPGHRCGE